MPDKEFKFFKDYDNFSDEITAPRSNCVLDVSKLESYMKVRSVKDALKDALSRYII